MTAPRREVPTRDHYLAEANAELDAMLGEVGELDTTPPERSQGRSWMQVVLIAVIAAAVLALGILLLRGRRSGRMTVHMAR